MKKVYNPFEIFSEKQLLLFGLILLIVGSAIGFLFNGRFDGLVDLHFVEFADFHEVLIDNLINTVLLTLFLFLLGLFINPKTRIIDLLNTSLIARIPFYILPFFNANNRITIITDSLIEVAASNNLDAINMLDTLIIVVFGILALLTLIWFAVLLWNGFKVASNAKGTKNVVLLVTVVLVTEIASKYIILHFN
jgi:hypothetical protein